MLEVSSLSAGYGASKVLFEVTLHEKAGECVCLIGRNGMGKTTVMRSITGLTRLIRGDVHLEGRSVKGLSAFDITRLSLRLVPEDRRIFADLTVEANLRVADGRKAWTLERVYALFPEIKDLRALREVAASYRAVVLEEEVC